MKKFAFAMISGLVLLSCGTNAAETGLVREFYACHFKEGKGMADLEGARDVLLEQFGKMGSTDLDDMISFVWTPFMGGAQIDFLWFNMNQNLNAWGRATDAYNGSEHSAAAQAAFDEMSECVNSGVAMAEVIYDGGELQASAIAQAGGAAFIEAFNCTLRPGKTVADARAAVENWQGVIKDLGMYDSYLAYMMTPLVASGTTDVFYFAAHPDATSYAARQTAYLTSDAGAAADARFNEVHRCTASLWHGHPYITAEQ